MFDSASARIPSNTFERWLTSRIDIPTPGSDSSSRCACSSTGIGRIAGPAEKLKIRVAVFIGQISCINNPSRNLGSNQVDLGGMIEPAFDTIISSFTLTGYIE